MWAKVDDGWWCHPKVMGLSMAARGLWTSALSWSCAQRVDEVPGTFLGMVGGTASQAAELVDAGLWIVSDAGWRIHQWSEYQDLSTSEKRAIAGRKGGRRSAAAKRTKNEANDEANEANMRSDLPERASKPKQEGFACEANGQAGPNPSHPDPYPTPPPPESQDYSQPDRPEPSATVVVDDQMIRRAANLVGHSVAAVATGVGDRSAYAASVTKRILTGDDPTDRDEIRQALTDGSTPEQVAEGWEVADPLAGSFGPRAGRAEPSEAELAAIRDRAAERIAADRVRLDERLSAERADPEVARPLAGAARAALRGGAS